MRNILKIARLEFMRSRNIYDRRVLLIFLPSLVVILLFFFLFLRTGNLFEEKFYRVACEDDETLRPIFDSNSKLVVVDGGSYDIWTRALGKNVIIHSNLGLRSTAATQSLLKSIKEYNRLVFSAYPDDVVYPVWVKTEVVKKNYSDRERGLNPLTNLSQRVAAEEVIVSEETNSGSVGLRNSVFVSNPVSGGVEDLKDIYVDGSVFDRTRQVDKKVEKRIRDGYITPEDLTPAIPFEPIYMSLTIIVVLTFITISYSNRVFDEKVNKKGSLLLIAPVKTYEIIAGKTLPYVLTALILSMAVAVLKTQNILSLLFLVFLITVIALVYFSIAFVVALMARSFKELSFLGIFYISVYSLFLLIPSFLIGFSEASYASPLTVVVKLLLNEAVEPEVFVFTTVPHILLSSLLFYIGGLVFTSENLFSYKNIASKVVDTYENFLRKPYYLIYSSMAAVPFVFILEMMLVVVLISINAAGSLVFVLFLSAFIEEFFKALGVYAVYSRRLFPVNLRSAVAMGVYTGLGFFLAEKLMLLIVIAAFIPGYSVIIFAGLVIPFILHILLSVLFSLGLYRFGHKSMLVVLVFVSLLHFAVNYFINLVAGGVA